MKRLFLYIFILFFLVAKTAVAAPITVKAKIDSTKMWIGNQTALRFEITQDKNQIVRFPLFRDTVAGPLEVVNMPTLDTVKISDKQIQVNLKYTITAFDDSLVYIPAYPFVSGNDTTWSNTLSLKVIQPFKVDTASHKIADIKPVFKPDFNWKKFFLKFLLVALILALLAMLFILYRKFKGKKITEVFSKPKPVLPPYEEAINKLDEIKNSKMWQQGRIKEYHTEVTDTIRTYIERTFDVNSWESTSGELLEKMQFLKLDKPAAFDGLKQILQVADLAKFAKWIPDTKENELSLMNAYLFVNQTKIEEIQPVEETLKESDEKSSDTKTGQVKNSKSE